jgi:hypothetical protein
MDTITRALAGERAAKRKSRRTLKDCPASSKVIVDQ